MPIRLNDAHVGASLFTGNVQSTLDNSAANVDGTHTDPASNTAFLQTGLDNNSADFGGLFDPAPFRTGNISSTLQENIADFSGSNNEGWWWLQFGNLATLTLDATALAEPNIKGLQLTVTWRSWETAEFTFDTASMDALFNTLKANGKRLMVELALVRFVDASGHVGGSGGTQDPWTPTYMASDGATYGEQGGSNTMPAGAHLDTRDHPVANYFLTPVYDKLVAAYQALFDRYGADSAFAGVFIGESSLTPPTTAAGGSDLGYTNLKLHEFFRDITTDLRAMMPTKALAAGVNFLSTASLFPTIEDYIDHLTSVGVGVSGPDFRFCFTSGQLYDAQRHANLPGGNWEQIVGGYRMEGVWLDSGQPNGYNCELEADRPLAAYNFSRSTMSRSKMFVIDMATYNVGSPSFQDLVTDPVTYPYP